MRSITSNGGGLGEIDEDGDWLALGLSDSDADDETDDDGDTDADGLTDGETLELLPADDAATRTAAIQAWVPTVPSVPVTAPVPRW